MVTSIGETVFNSLLEQLTSPVKIAYELPGFGVFELREKKFRETYRKMTNDTKKNWEPLLENLENFKNKRIEVRQKRKDYVAQQKCEESSQDQPEAYKIISSG